MAFQEPVTDFSDGLAVLRGYHQHFLAHCKTLRHLAQQVEIEMVNAKTYSQARVVFDFLTAATKQHHRDEEKALFPQLDSTSEMLQAMIERLEEDHIELEQGWEEIGPLLAQPETGLMQTDFPALARRYAQLLQWHIEREDANFLPRIEEDLSPSVRAAIGLQMLGLRQSAKEPARVTNDGVHSEKTA